MGIVNVIRQRVLHQMTMLLIFLGCVLAGSSSVAQVPGAVFSSTGASLGMTSQVFPVQDGQAAVARIAVNAKGDTFWVNAGYSGASPYTLVEVPGGSTGGNASQISILAGIPSGSGSAYIDPNQNLWVAGNQGNTYYIPFVNNSYATGLTASALPNCSLPLSAVTSPCFYTAMDTPPYNYYVCSWDIQVDTSGNIYLVNRGLFSVNQIIKVTGGTTSANPTVSTIYGNFPYTGGPASLAVTTSGDVWYADGTNLSYLASGSSTPTIISGFKNASGVTLDGAGNLYVSDTGNSRIAVIPKIGSSLNATYTYTLANVLTLGAVAVDAYGTVTYASGSGSSPSVTSILRLPVSSRNLGTAAVGASTAASELDLYFTLPDTFGSFAIAGGSGSSVPFSITSNGCVTGTAYTTNSECVTTLKYTATAPGPQYGAILAYDKTGNLLASAALVGTGTAPLIDVDPGTVTAIGTTWKSPSSIAVDPSGNTYVADSITGGIYKNGSSTAIVTGFNQPSAVVVDGGSNLYVADSGNSRIMRIPFVNNAYSTPVPIYTGLSGPSGLALDASGNLYVADSGNSRVLLLAPAGGYSVGTLSSTIGSGYSKPVAVAVDGAGNVYVGDNGTKAVTEWLVHSKTSNTIFTGLTTVGGIAFDPGGSLFVVDAGKKSITRIPNIGGILTAGSSTLLSTIVSSPVAIAIDTAGNVYAADTSDGTVGTMTRSMGSLSYGPVVQTVASQSLTALISNAGTAGLTFSSPFYSATGSTTAFAVQNSSTCANGVSVATGTTCNLSAVFTPPAVSTYSETLTFASNAKASSLVLSGTGVILVNATISGPTTLTYGYGATTYTATASHDGTYSVNITGSSTATASVVITNGSGAFQLPTLGVGNFTISLAGAVGTASLSVTPATLTLTASNATRPFGSANPTFTVTSSGAKNGDSYVLSGSSVATITSPTGTYAIVPAASGPGLSNYNLVLVNGVLTVTTAASNTTLTVTSTLAGPSNTFTQGGTVTFSAAVAAQSPAVGKPTGTVTFENVNNPSMPVSLGTATLSGGVATFQTTALPPGTIAVIAVYMGDMNFQGSTTVVSTTVTIDVANFTLQISQGQGTLASVLPMTIVQGQTGSATLTVTPVGPFTQPVTFYCSNLPLEASCSFFNSTVTPNGGPVTATVVISTTATTKAALTKGRDPWNRSQGLTLLAFTVGAFVGWHKRRLSILRLCTFLLLSASVMIPLSGCGLSESPFVTPLGVTEVNITATSPAIGTQQSVTVRLAVTN